MSGLKLNILRMLILIVMLDFITKLNKTMIKRLTITLLFVYLLNSCESVPEQTKHSIKSYQDSVKLLKVLNIPTENCYQYYDLITLEGKGTLDKKALKFPFVSIKKTEDSIQINHYIDNDHRYLSTYFKDDGYWNREYKLKKGQALLLFKEFIIGDSIVSLQYDYLGDLHLASVSIYTNATIKTYAFEERNIKYPTSLNEALKYINTSRIFSVTTSRFTIRDDSVHLAVSEKVFNDPLSSSDNKFVFETFGEPFDSWMIFRWKTYSYSFLYMIDRVRGIN